MHSPIQKIFKQTSYQLIGKAVSSVVTIFVLGIITRNFGESGTGVFTLALTYLAFFVVAADFGVNAHVLPRMNTSKKEPEWRRLLGFRILLGLLLIGLSYIIAIFLNISDPRFYQIVLIGSFFAVFETVIYVTCNAIFQAKLSYHLSALSSSIGALVIGGLVFFMASFSNRLENLIWAYSVGWIVVSLIALTLIKKFIKNIRPVVDFSYIKTLIRESWPISATLLLNMVYFRIDAFILTSFRGFSEVGIYNLSYMIFQNILVLPTFIMNGYYPLMIKAHLESKRLFFFELKKAGVVMLGLAILGMVGTLIFSPTLINLLTGGQSFSGSSSVLKILSMSLPAFFVSSLLMWTLVTLQKYKAMLAIYVLGLLVNSILNLIFIPQYGFLAAAWVTVGSEYLILVAQMIILWKEFCIGKKDVICKTQ